MPPTLSRCLPLSISTYNITQAQAHINPLTGWLSICPRSTYRKRFRQQDEDGKSECEAEESDGGAASGFVVDDGYLSADEVRNDVDGDGDDAMDGEADGEPALSNMEGHLPGPLCDDTNKPPIVM